MPPDEKVLKRARSGLLRLLGYRARSRKEAEEYLERRGFESTVISAVLKEMEQWHYIDDQNFTSEYIESCLRRGWGPLRVRFALLSKGVSSETVTGGLESHYSPVTEESLARRVLTKRVACDDRERDKKWVRRQIAYLQRRGFHDQVIIKALKEHCPFFDS